MDSDPFGGIFGRNPKEMPLYSYHCTVVEVGLLEQRKFWAPFRAFYLSFSTAADPSRLVHPLSLSAEQGMGVHHTTSFHWSIR